MPFSLRADPDAGFASALLLKMTVTSAISRRSRLQTAAGLRTRQFIVKVGRVRKRPAALVAGVAWWTLATAAQAASPAALLAQSPEGDGLSNCIQRQFVSREALKSAGELSEGLEFRLTLEHGVRGTRIMVITGYLKPDISALAGGHDADPEAQLTAALPFYRQLRVPIGTRVWLLDESGVGRACREAAAWISAIRSRPVRLDRMADSPHAH